MLCKQLRGKIIFYKFNNDMSWIIISVGICGVSCVREIMRHKIGQKYFKFQIHAVGLM